ncbi:pseudouridine synthase [Propionivibrio dicarboxylicus]|uniref:pseudouridine synthase n=1 Tax=Propionivibrio dicarboxylicus TaxID=83767 RepID=UPI000B86E053|nr:16S rRNA pseudouridine(516) synthase [Propionivibrio dicarboxylicus]
MRLDQLLQSQGFGSRNECRRMIECGRVSVGDAGIIRDPDTEIVLERARFVIDGVEFIYQRHVYIVLNKPADFECSHRPERYPSVFSLLPPDLVRRGVQAVGRLDSDTTGLLLLSDDGQFIHALSSPKKAVPKCYEVIARHSVPDTQLEQLEAGVVLRDDPQPAKAISCERVSETIVRMSVTEGRYHLVKRMIAATGNRVEQLRRVAIGGFQLPSSLAPGEWRWLESDELQLLGWKASE